MKYDDEDALESVVFDKDTMPDDDLLGTALWTMEDFQELAGFKRGVALDP